MISCIVTDGCVHNYRSTLSLIKIYGNRYWADGYFSSILDIPTDIHLHRRSRLWFKSCNISLRPQGRLMGVRWLPFSFLAPRSIIAIIFGDFFFIRSLELFDWKCLFWLIHNMPRLRYEVLFGLCLTFIPAFFRPNTLVFCLAEVYVPLPG